MHIAGKSLERTLDHILSYYQQHRRSFPWRETADPYRILVSEYMLQQTQADRVAPKYLAFLKKFPTVQHLADADMRLVLAAWVGLGYNRRAIAIRNAAKIIVSKYNGVVPETVEDLLMLPGVGPYTAGAVAIFAYNKEVAIVETNIRTVVLHYHPSKACTVSDAMIQEVVAALLTRAVQRGVPVRIFYSAFMDIGAYLKRSGVRVNHRSQHYVRQGAFSGSVRQARGAIVRLCVANRKGILLKDCRVLGLPRTDEALAELLKEGILQKRNNRYHIKG